MNKSGSSSDFMRTLLIGFLLFIGMRFFFDRFGNNKPPARTAPALAKAFEGVDPAMGTPLTATTATDEVKKLQANVQSNGTDPLGQWSQLRIALIQQYVLGTLQSSTRSTGWFGMGGQQKYYPAYDDVIKNNASNDIEAQAIYQEGDLLWRESIQPNSATKGQPSADAVAVLEQLIHRGRGNAAFGTASIYVPVSTSLNELPLQGLPVGGFKLVPVSSLRGTSGASSPQTTSVQTTGVSNPQSAIVRVNQYYATSPQSGTISLTLYKIFDGAVHLLGDNPAYSYGLAVLLFAIFTRSAMQPIYKKQYESMKGMAAIAPEMKKIQEKYKGKSENTAQMAQMKEIQELQRRHGVNPMLGCGLALIQMPIFFLIVYPMIQHYEPKLEMVGASFLWVHSLAQPDIPLLVLYAISMFFSFRLSSTPPTDDMQRQQQMILAFAGPFLFPILIATYPAAFVMYWMTYNALGTFYQWRLMKAADPSKDFWTTLKGEGFLPNFAAFSGAGAGANTSTEAVAPRPTAPNKNGSAKPKSVKIQSKTPALNGTLNGNNGSHESEDGLNGTNGVHHSAPEGSVLEPSADEIEKRKKKKK